MKWLKHPVGWLWSCSHNQQNPGAMWLFGRSYDKRLPFASGAHPPGEWVFCRWAKVELDGAVRPIRVVLECKHLKAVLGWTPSGQRQSASLGYVFDLTLSDGSSPPQTHSPPWVPSCFFYSIPTSLIPGFSWILLCFWEKVKMNSSQCCFSRFLPTQNHRFTGPV